MAGTLSCLLTALSARDTDQGPASLALVRGLMDALRVTRDPISEREAQRGLPGCVVTAADVKLLELKPFRMFRAGEIVAYEDATPTPQSPPPSSTSPASIPGPARVVMRYARVVSAGDAGAAGVRMVQLRIAGGSSAGGSLGGEGTSSGGVGGVSVVTLLATEVFSFKSAREVAAASAAAASQGQGLGATQGQGLGLPVVMGISSIRPTLPPPPTQSLTSQTLARSSALPVGPDTPSPSTSATGASPSAGAVSGSGVMTAMPNPHHQQAVGTSEVLSALNSLLVRAGVPLAPNEHSLVARVVELDSQNKQLQADLSQERVSLNDMRVELQQATVAYRCQICVSEAVSIVMVPCGHVTCGTCSASLRGSRCPFCRSAIQQKVQVFHSADA